MKRCIVNVAIGGNYAEFGQPRLLKSIAEHGEGVDVLTWKNEYPPDSPTEKEAPRAFKLYAMLEAMRQGYDQILWLDSSAYLNRSIQQMWNRIAWDGYYFVGWTCALGYVAPDEGLQVCRCTREQANEMTLMLAGCWGISLTKPIGRAILQHLLDMAAAGANVGDDGRDETPMTVMVHRWDLRWQPQPAMFNTWEHKDGSALIQFQGV